MLIVVRENKCEYATFESYNFPPSLHHSLFLRSFWSRVDIVMNHNAACRSIVDTCIFTTVSLIMYLGQLDTIGWVDVAIAGGHVCQRLFTNVFVVALSDVSLSFGCRMCARVRH